MSGSYDGATGFGGAGPLLVLVRHGQTNANIIKALDSRPPGSPLNRRGLAQAEAVAEALAVEPVIAVYASTALRAQQTAAPIAARHGLEVEVVEGVHEVYCGALEGRSDPQARECFDEVYATWAEGALDRPLPGGESARQLQERFLPAVERIWRRHASGESETAVNQAVVLVSHGAAIRLAAAALIGEYAETRYVPNAGRVVLAPIPGVAPAPGGWLLKYWEESEPAPGDVTGGADD